jgi:hypothetical protein
MFGIKKLKAEIVELRQEMQDLRDLTDDNHNEQWDLLRQVHTGVNSNMGALAVRLNDHIRTRVDCVTCYGCGCLVDRNESQIHVNIVDDEMVPDFYCRQCAESKQAEQLKEIKSKSKKEKSK